jgi:phenylalanyl-tRNA synthetase beta chain
MIQSGLEVIAHNLNRKNQQLFLYEFGKTYHSDGTGNYSEKQHLVIFATGNLREKSWNQGEVKADFFHLKAVVENVLRLSGIKKYSFDSLQNATFSNGASLSIGPSTLAVMGEVNSQLLKKFDIKQSVFYADIDTAILTGQKTKPVQYRELPRFPVVNRDLAVLVDKNVSYSQIEQIALSHKIGQLTSVRLFDIFESEKLGSGKKSMAVSFTFLDENKTLTDKEIDGYMQTIINGFESKLKAEIRK